jgi:serine/threonine protein kinase
METIQNYQILRILGKGSFATVYLALRISDHSKCALKKVNLATKIDRLKGSY